MADQSTQSIVIDAPPAAIMAVIADFPAYPRWAASVKSAEVVSTLPDGRAEQVRFVLDAGVVKDDYVLAYEWSGDERVDWRLVRGQMQKSQQGSYVLRPLGGSATSASSGPTEVTYHLAVDLAIPMLGMFKRKAEKVIMDTALKELKKRVEG
ncbi:MAG: SRPBCC family protein [Mycobacteriales bacterium]